MKTKARKNVKIHTSGMSDDWTKTTENLADAAVEQTAADLDLVVATRELAQAHARHDAAVARKTKAESRLSKLRADLGVEVAS